MRQNWPERLWLVRHGQSQGNVARDKADAAGHSVIELDVRDVDVPLSDLGMRQAEAAGRWFTTLPVNERPEVILSSPYLRARQTATAICDAGALAGGKAKSVIDERLREREFGVFDGLTTRGIREKFPEEAAHRAKMGKFYHRPPGGESWADVILRLRSALNTINLLYADRRVVIVCHQVVVLCMRYILEHLTEEDLLAIDKNNEIANCSVTMYEHDQGLGPRGNLRLSLFNFVAPLEEAGTTVTAEPDAKVGAR